jgi:hypothetical protein
VADVLAFPSAVRDHAPAVVPHPDGEITFTALSAVTTPVRTVVTVSTHLEHAPTPVYLVFTCTKGEWAAHGIDAGTAIVTVPPGLALWLEDVAATARQDAAS